MASSPLQGTHSMWNDHYKGSVYPLALNDPPFNQRSKSQVLSLLDACSSYIVRDSNLTRAAISSVPKELYVNLMKAALLGNHDRSIHVLMSKWVLQTLVLKKMVPTVFSSILPFYDRTYQSELVRQGLRYTTSLAHTFLECLRQNPDTKIRYLDLTGFPTAEVILYYLASHCMLVHNEARRDNMVNLYNQAVNIAEEFKDEFQQTHDAMEVDRQNYLPQDIKIAIKLDAFVTTESCHSELCKALTVSTFPHSRFQIIVEKLSITCLGGDRVNLILRQINPLELQGLQLKYNCIKNMDLVRMSPVLQSLVNLQSLDLSCNRFSFINNEPILLIFCQALSTLSNLRRLDLSNCRLKNRLSPLLRSISAPLKQLRLAACGLSSSDLSILSESPTISQIEELDLSENLNFHASSLIGILQKIRNTVKIFELEDCNMDDEFLMRIETCFSIGFHNLLFLNVAKNSWSTVTSGCFVQILAKLKDLKVLRLSYSRDCYPEILADLLDPEELKQHFKMHLADTLQNNTDWNDRNQCFQFIFV